MTFEASAVRLFQETPFRVMLQLFTLVALHVTVVEPPLNTRSGFAVIESTGMTTATVAWALAKEPLDPVQMTEYAEVVTGLTAALPEVALPVENPPGEVQLTAFVDDHVSVEDCPATMVSGEAESEAVTTDALVLQN